ncbi:MAG: hypothetical protein M1561_04470 [Gammaproteobacteria bacterium]|nr:hypothetical protein [Gammaproteobacteria bacterium]
MINYILERLQIDSDHLLALFKHEQAVGHPVVKGRLREILVNNILSPWLPLGIKCGTGIIIDAANKITEAGQEDILLYDELLAPPILGSNNTPDGVFLVNSVLCRIEVKSKLTRPELKKFIARSQQVNSLKFTVRSEYIQRQTGAFNLLFAYQTDCTSIESEYQRLLDVFHECNCPAESGIVSMICIPGVGFIKINEVNGKRLWQKLNKPDSKDHISYFVGCVSDACYVSRMTRQNRDPKGSLEGGVGMYLDSPYENIQ